MLSTANCKNPGGDPAGAPNMGTDDAKGPENQQDIIETESIVTQTITTAAAPTDDAFVDNVRDDSVALESIEPPDIEKPTLTRLPSVIQTASNQIKRLLQDGRASFSRLTAGHRRDKSAAVRAFKGLRFISNADGAKGWPAIEKRFDDLAVHGSLPRSRFGQCIYNSQYTKDSTEFAGVLFDALARRRNITRDSINREELKEFWDQISDQSFDSRLQTFFDMVDKNADGVLNVEEVREIISLSASANKLSKIKEQAEEYARLIMEELDTDNDGYIEIYNLEMLLLQAQSQSVQRGDTENRRNLSRILSENLKTTHPLRRWYRKSTHFLEGRWKRGWVVALWLSICAGLFAWKFIQYRHRAVYHVMGYCVCVAKGGAETLKFNMALVLFPVCRNTITWLRNKTKLGTLVPFDDNLKFHKLISSGIVVGVVLHAISHLTCDFPRLLHASDQAYIAMKPFFGSARPNNYWWFVKGIEGWTGVLMVVLMAIAFTLALPCFRSGGLKLPKPFNRIVGFNSFWYTHHIFVIVYVLLVIHGFFLYLTKEWYKKTTWMYLAVPMILFAGERLTRVFRSNVRPVKIMKVEVYPGDVLNLHVTKPGGFEYQSGQYMFVHCAAVSPFEWHPFSITSAPEDDYLSVHIRAAGDWTRQIKAVFSKACGPSNGQKNGVFRAEYNPSWAWDSSDQKLPRVMIDGPYGAPAQEYKNYEVVLLVGLGIGATPFISVVKDILNNLEQLDSEGELEDVESGCGGDGGRASSFKTRQAYLYWMTREQGSFEWFREMMNEVAESDNKGAIELHNYCTSVFEERDVRSALITMLQWLNYAKNGIDVVSGTKVKTHFARPEWREVFKRIAHHHQGQRIGVFYCGKPNPVKELRQLALDFSKGDGTKFDFHKENF